MDESTLIQIVDSNNVPVRGGTKKEAWAQGLYHRCVHVMIFRSDGQVLLQQRAANKFPFPLRWSHAVSGHVDEGETYEQAMQREMHEELGLSLPATLLGDFDLHYSGDDWGDVHRFDRAYVLTVPHDIVLTPAPDEVADVRWIELDELKAWAQRDPRAFSYPTIRILEVFY